MLKLFSILSLQFLFITSFAQPVLYYQKLSQLIGKERYYPTLIKQIDSLKQTRQPHDSHVKEYLNRDIDFGYKHLRLDVAFNSTFYVVDFVLKNDSIIFSNTHFSEDFYADTYKKYKTICIDTTSCLKFLGLKNHFYASKKDLNDLNKEITSNQFYAFNCGDGLPKTWFGIYVSKLAKNYKIKNLNSLLQSINCEDQQFAIAGFEMITANKKPIPPLVSKIINHVKQRNSDLIICSGCFMGIVKKEYN